ncbi:hypothetical protein [Runella sp.]|uniref:hypothetical protein n=1 Tax=Runella sp. TaxID=1960881 RepID=UPI003D115009
MESLLSFLQNLPLPETVRKAFFSAEQFKHDQKLFLTLGSVFAPAFPGLSSWQELRLNAACYLGSLGIYQLDTVLDEQVQGTERITKAYQGQLLMLESQRILSHLFELQHPFWETYYKRVEKHYHELILSKDISEPLTETGYLHLLEHKYAMLYVPLDALFFLTGQTQPVQYATIEASLQLFCKGYNLPNEVMGMAEDMSLGITNYAYWRLKDSLKEIGIEADDYGYEELHTLLYASGLGETLLDEAVEAFREADLLAKTVKLPGYQKLIYYRIENVLSRKKVIEEHKTIIS